MERITYQDLPEGLFEKLGAIENYLSQCPIEPRLLNLVRLSVSQINGCAYCVDMHHKELQHIGETDLRLYSLCVWEETPYFSEKERVVLAFAKQVTRLDAKPISDEVYDPLLAFFNKEEICYLSLAITQINTWNRLMKVFGFKPGLHKVV